MPEAEPEEFEVSESQQGNMPNQVELPSSAALQMRAFRMVEQERMRMRDSLSFERQHPSNLDVDGPLMPPVPESRDYSVAEERQREIYRLRQVRQDLRRMARRHPAPTPPYTDSDLAFLARTDSPRLSSSLTPVLSPSHQPSTGDMDSPPRRPLEEADFSFSARGHPYTDVSVIPGFFDLRCPLKRLSYYYLFCSLFIGNSAIFFFFLKHTDLSISR